MRAAPLSLGLAALLLLASGGSVAQFDDGGTFEVGGVAVDVGAKDANAARLGGWRLAQRKAWIQLSKRLGAGGGLVSDGTLDSLVSAIAVENEQIGPDRYIARLDILFSRARVGALLGIATMADRSPPMLLLPVQWSAGVGRAFEAQTDWQQAWARFRSGSSDLDYVRPTGTGPDALLLNVGQTGRPGRGWWRTILDQYGARDVLVPTVRLYRQWPGGPVIGVFQARHGPDNELIGGFTLRVPSGDGLAQLLDVGVKRIDAIYANALASGALATDVTLSPPPAPTPIATESPDADTIAQTVDDIASAAGAGIPVSIQYDTPTETSVANVESAMRGIPGVRTATTTSLALGGLSVMRVTFDGDPALLKSALESRGYQVLGSGQALRIRRAPTLIPPSLPTDTATTG